MDLSSKDAEILESVADTTKSVQELADDNMKRVAVRLAANCINSRSLGSRKSTSTATCTLAK
jgi:hypothetical protein